MAVGVVVDFERSPVAGGHVRFWERVGEAAVGVPGLDLTVHFLGRSETCLELSDNVRYRTHRPVLPSARLGFLAPDPTDLSPWSPGLLGHLGGYDVLHSTGAHFAFARTALRFAEKRGRAIALSLHTDSAKYARMFAATLLSDMRLPHRGLGSMVAGRMKRRVYRYARRCDWVFVSSASEVNMSAFEPPRTSWLRRGVDKERIHPSGRARSELEQRYHIPAGRTLILCVGRIDESKNPRTLADAALHLIERGHDVHVMFVGRGDQRAVIEAKLMGRVTCTGQLPQNEIRRLYPSADLFVLPSPIERFPSAVLEAKSAGLPVIVSAVGGSRQMIHRPGMDGLLVGDAGGSGAWADAIERLVVSPARRMALGAAARQDIERRWPSWRSVLEEDLMPVWGHIFEARARRGPAPADARCLRAR